MMKKIIAVTALASMTLLSGCAMGPYTHGFVYSDIDRPLDVRDNAVACTKKGEASMTNILNLFATGDASLAKAKSNAGITKVGTVDVGFTNILGIIQTSTTTVCGE